MRGMSLIAPIVATPAILCSLGLLRGRLTGDLEIDMDKLQAMIVITGLFVLAIIGVIQVFRQRLRARLRGPFGTRLTIDASNAQQSTTTGVRVEQAKSKEGGLRGSRT